MPRRFSSSRRSVSMPVRARTSEVLPWSMCPAVPTTMCFMRKLLALVSVALLLPAQPPPIFRSEVTQVRVDVQVFEGKHPVTDLAKSDFLLFDDNQPQTIAGFGREQEPLSLLLLLDVSGSMSRYVEQAIHTASAALKSLRPEDQVAVMLFSRRTQLVQPFTSDMRYVNRALQHAATNPELGNGSLINPSLLDSIQIVRTAVEGPRRRAILILTDNAELNYLSPDEPVIQGLLETGTVLDAIVVGRYGRPKPPKPGYAVNPDFTPADVFRIAEASGGGAVQAERVDKLFPQMIERIRQRYSLQYVPPISPRGTFRHIRVELTPEARERHPKAVIHAREGYYAS